MFHQVLSDPVLGVASECFEGAGDEVVDIDALVGADQGDHRPFDVAAGGRGSREGLDVPAGRRSASSWSTGVLHGLAEGEGQLPEHRLPVESRGQQPLDRRPQLGRVISMICLARTFER